MGDGPEAPTLRRRADALAIGDCVVWHGWRPDPWASVQAASLLLLTSRVEGFGLVLAEALARGIPILAMDCPVGPAEIVLPDRNGWLVAQGDVPRVASLVDGICGGTIALPAAEDVKATASRFAPHVVARRMVAAVEELRTADRTAPRAAG